MEHALLQDVRTLIDSWEPRDERGDAALKDARGALAEQPPALWRRPARTHFTSSAFALSPDLERVLLVHHAKGDFWVQPGGHPEQEDATVIGAALRELAEETGTSPASGTSPVVVDLDHHALSGAFGHCASHLDFGVAVIVDPAAPLLLSEESHDVAWFGVDELPASLPSDFQARLERVLAAARTRSAIG